MKKLSSRRVIIKAVVAVFIVFCIGMFSVCGQSVKWVGSTDLQVRFIVTDAVTGLPIPDATIQIHAEAGSYCSDRERRNFSILTDSNGSAEHACEECMCFGSRSCFEDTFAVHVPWWWFNAQAKGYGDSEREYLDVPKYSRRVQRSKPSAKLTVSIQLQKVTGGEAN